MHCLQKIHHEILFFMEMSTHLNTFTSQFSVNVKGIVLLCQVYRSVDIGGSRGGAPPAHAPPQQNQFLSFSHTFLPKSVPIGGWHPPNGSAPPQWDILDPPLVDNGDHATGWTNT